MDTNILSQLDSMTSDEKLLLEARLIGMRELPPSIDQFLEDDYFIGESTAQGKAIYPKWREFLRELFPDPLHTTNTVVSLSGCIGSGKSRISRLILAYDYLKLTYFDNLQYAGLDNDVSGKSVDLLFEHRTGDKAWEELVDPFWTMVKKSPYFSNNLFNDYGTRFLVDGESTNKALGKDIVGCTFSETNFQRRDKIEAKVYELTSRLTARFQKLLPYLGHVVLDSSCNDEGNFMDDYLARTTWDVKSARFAIWEIKDFLNIYFNNGSFKVYAGDSLFEPFVIDSDSQIKDTMNQDKIIVCPKELENEARTDTRRFLKEKVGITTATTGSFFSNKQKIRDAAVLPCPVESVTVDFFDETDTVYNRVKALIESIPTEKKLYIGIDLGIVSDSTGFSIAYFDDWVPMGDNKMEPRIKVPLAIEISRIPGQETSIHKIEDLILTINKTHDVAMVVTDQFQSTQLRQNLTNKKIKCVLSSVDRTTEPYNYMKRMIYLGLLELPYNRILIDNELPRLLEINGKVDHPAVNPDGTPGRKDIADSTCNAVFNLMKDIQVAQLISNRYNTAVQMDILDRMGWFAHDEKSRVLAEIIRKQANS